ncbi:efflux transporter SaoE [Clostridium ihumii]|uniref:efflux transporter SaoE n=1 Tax=Clostridium ihumii TaxID=1470356 RepID=UPI003D338B64
MIILEFLKDLFWSSLTILNGASVWLVFSFVLAGFLHEILSPEKFQKILGNKKISSLIKSTISGMLLPICSCGVIPLGISLYYSGAYLGPTLAFMTSTPMINPVAVILCYGLLGKEITIIYVITGFLAPIIIGIIGNTFGGNELKAPGIEEEIERRVLVKDEKTFLEKIKIGMSWSLNDLALVVSKYVILGMVLASIIFNVVPQEFIQKYLGEPTVISLGGVTILAAFMYVCAVGHIPFIAALVASGAAPGIAITFLMAGAATNLPELISLYKIIGKRTAIIYSTVVVGISLIVGYITNIMLMPNFTPVLNFDGVNNSITTANKFMFIAPMWLKYLCSLIIFLFALKSFYKSFNKFLINRRTVKNN